MEKTLLVCFILFTFFFQASSPGFESKADLDAVEILSKSGHLAMSITLKLDFGNKASESSSLTVFATPDSVLKEARQKPLALLYYMVPTKYSMEGLRSLQYGSEIKTLFENHNLIVTTKLSDKEVSINDVTIDGSVLYENERMVIYSINKLFDLNFTKSPISTPSGQNSSTNLGMADNRYSEISKKLRHTHYSTIGNFLDLQLLGFGDETKLTIFAPDDDELDDRFSNSTESYGFVLRRHMVPVLLTLKDMMNLSHGAEISTYLKDFKLKFSKSGDATVLNGVHVVKPEIYCDDRVIIHGIEKLLELNDQHGLGDSFSGFHVTETTVVVDHGAIVCYLIQLLVFSTTIGMYSLFRLYPNLFYIPKFPEVYFNLVLLILEFVSFSIEFLAVGITIRLITIPLSYMSVCLVIAKHNHYGYSHSRAYTIFDWGLLMFTLNWVFFTRVTEVIGKHVLPKSMDIAGHWFSGISLLIHAVELCVHNASSFKLFFKNVRDEIYRLMDEFYKSNHVVHEHLEHLE